MTGVEVTPHEGHEFDFKLRQTGLRADVANTASDLDQEFHKPVTNGLVTAPPARRNGRKIVSPFAVRDEAGEMAEILTEKPTDAPVFMQSVGGVVSSAGPFW
ncbi:hypothetical protein [Methylobacterium fujisawaense]|uniref:hypothetical protein n=1 Tax=Methylobacterium fujisawaense TaxID=107400 RepID=UPI0036F93E21